MEISKQAFGLRKRNWRKRNTKHKFQENFQQKNK